MATTAIANDATDLNSILQSAMAGSYVAQGSGQTFTVSSTIVIHVTSTTQGPLGLDLGGGTIVSNITNGSPVIQVVVDPGVDLRYLTFSNLTIQGNGKEGDGIQIVAAGNDRWVYNFSVNNVTVNHVGGYGLDVQGSVFEGLVSNSWMTNDGKGGAYFSHLDGGQVSALHWFGGGFQNNGGAGLMLDNGARDMSVDGAKFVGNAGGGINAEMGITSVSNSDFSDNHGSAIAIQNYGNFNNNTFESTGAQTVGISGWLNGNATVVGNTSTWHGAGTDPTTLANLQGYGNVYATGDTGKIVTGSSLSLSGLGGGDAASVTHSSSGVALPSLSAVTSATTAAPAATHTGSPVETALNAAAAGTAQHLTSSNYSVSSPIVIHLTSADQGPINIDFGGAKIQSNISNGGPVIEIVVDQGVNVSQLTISNLMINGNGAEGDGIKIVADGTNRSIQKLSINQVNVEHVGGIGLDVIGNVHGTVFDSWMNGNNGGGARFANGANGGVADGLAWTGGGFRKNGVAGLILDNGTHDMKVTGAYFVENTGVGIDATSGITLVKESGFENNGGTAVVTNGTANFVSDTFSTWGPQQTAIGGYLNGGTVNISGTDKEYYGPGSDTSMLANFQGTGTVAIAGSGNIVAGSGITVTGSGLTASNAGGVPAGLTGTTTTGTGTGSGTGTAAPVLTEALVSDTGSSASDGITSSAALKGTSDAGATVHFTVDGTAVAATATANASGAWTFTPTGLADGQHTVVASETNAAGQTGSASLTFTLDTKAPTVTEALVGGGTSSSTGALTGTAAPNAVVKFTVDGTAVTGTATADASGNWSYTPSSLSAGTHTVVASTTDVAGNAGSASLTFTTTTSTSSGSTGGNSGTGTGTTTAPSGTAPTFTAGSYANGQLTVTGTTPAANETVWIYDGNNWVGAVTSDANGKFTFTESAASGSSHAFGAIAIDSTGGQTKTASSFTYTADATSPPPAAAPTVTAALTSDTGSSATDKVTSVATVSGTADPNATVHFTVDGTAVTQTATASANGAWTFSPTGLADGPHTIVASETNTGGTGSASVSFTLDTKAPTVTSQLASDTGVSATDKITSNATVSGTAAPNAVVSFTVDGKAVAATATADASGKWSFTPTGLADGAHTVVASQTDAAGNASSASLSFTLDTTAPAVTAQAMASAQTQALTLAATSSAGSTASAAGVTGTGDANATVHFTIDGTAVTQTSAADATGAWSYTPAGLAIGSHTVVASETDLAGNTGQASLSLTTSMSTGTGTGTGTTPAPTLPVFTDASFANGQVTVTGSTPVGNETVWIYDGSTWAGWTTSDASGHFTFGEAAASGSSHSFGAIAIDSLGNTTKTDAAFAYTATAGSTTTSPPPAAGGLPIVTEHLVSDTGASATDGITANPALTGTADAGASVHFTVDGTSVATTATADASGHWSYTPSGLGDGFHTVVASETNAAGATGAATIGFTYDTHAPIPTFTGVSVANSIATITGTTGEAGDSVTIYDGNSWLGVTTTGADGTFTYTASAAAGVHSYGSYADGPAGEGHTVAKAILGSTGADTLVGSTANDVIVGNGGNDVITGGLGADKLTGGSGNATFTYNAAAESTSAAADTITDFHHGDKIDFTSIAGINANNGTPTFQGYLTGAGSQTVNAHSVAVMEVGGNTQVLVNTTGAAETVTATDTHAADMKVTLVGVNLALTGTDFHHN